MVFDALTHDQSEQILELVTAFKEQSAAFYKILMDHYPQSPGKLSSARIEFVEKNAKTDEYANGLVDIGGNNKQLVWDLIRDTHHKIQNLEFTKGCREEDCYWCSMQLNNGLVM